VLCQLHPARFALIFLSLSIHLPTRRSAAMEAIEPGGTGRRSRPSRYYHRAELADVLSREHGFSVTKNMLDKAAHFGDGPTPAGRWGKYVLYTLPEGLRWCRERFRRHRSLQPARDR
jgi:hypothetical protein